MNQIKIFLSFLLVICCAEVSYAQQKISVKIIDSENQQPLTGVIVVAENNNNKQIVGLTNEDGRIQLSIVPPCFLTIHLIGYNEIKISLNEFDTTISLIPSTNRLQEVVVTGEYN